MTLSSQWNFAAFLALTTEGAVEGKGTVAVSATVVTGSAAGAGALEIVAGLLRPFESGDASGGTILTAVGVITVLMALLLCLNP